MSNHDNAIHEMALEEFRDILHNVPSDAVECRAIVRAIACLTYTIAAVGDRISLNRTEPRATEQLELD